MARVFMYFNDPPIKSLLRQICQDEGHEIIGAVDTVGETLAVLRSTLRPVVAILEWDLSSYHPDTPLMPTIHQYPDNYGQHRYIPVHWRILSEEDKALLAQMHIIDIPAPFHMDALLDAVTRSAALLPE